MWCVARKGVLVSKGNHLVNLIIRKMYSIAVVNFSCDDPLRPILRITLPYNLTEKCFTFLLRIMLYQATGYMK